MTNPETNNQPQPQYAAPAPQVAPQKKEKNVLGIVALITSIVGFIFACIPGALIIGWVLLPISFILAIVSLFMKGKGKGMGIAGLIISVVGTIVGVVVFISVVATSFDEAFSGGETTVATPEGTEDEAGDGGEEQGTRANPYPIGTAITQGDWTVTINSVNLDATAEITADNMFNDAPDAGMVYILVNVTATYNGTDAEGASPWSTVNYVTVDGVTIDGTEKFISPPDAFDITTVLYEGASTTGNVALQVPADTAGEGVLAVNPTMMGDKVFVAVQ